MYIEFSLPSGAGGMAAAYIAQQIRRHLADWSERYQIEFTGVKTVKYTLRATFRDPKYYNFFALTWDPDANQIGLKSYIKNFRLVEPMDPPKTN